MTVPYFEGSVSADSFSSSARHKDQGHLKQAIQEFLTSKSEGVPERALCPHCGKRMQYINATFSLYGADGEWELTLPVCECSVSLPNDKNASGPRARAG